MVGYLLYFPQQIAHKATHGETGLKYLYLPHWNSIFISAILRRKK